MSADVNTVSFHKTHFLAAVELIKEARKKFEIPSENWPYPAEYRYGFPGDNYYAEIWMDGMDWQPTYWIIEAENLNRPKCYPFIIFDSNGARGKYNDYDFRQLVYAMMHFRRDTVWIKEDPTGHYNDTVWSFTKRLFPIHQDRVNKCNCDRFVTEHASQKPVVFFANLDYIPEVCKTPKRWYSDFQRFLRDVGDHPYKLSFSRCKEKQRNIILEKGEEPPKIDYVGFSCVKTGCTWYISKETAEETLNLAGTRLKQHEAQCLHLLIDACNVEESDERIKAQEDLLQFININVRES